MAYPGSGAADAAVLVLSRFALAYAKLEDEDASTTSWTGNIASLIRLALNDRSFAGSPGRHFQKAW